MASSKVAGLQNYWIETSRGRVVFVGPEPRPKVILIHGFSRILGQVIDWRARLPNLSFMILPGHGGFPELSEVSLRAWIEAWREAFEIMGVRPYILGESLGAMLGMALPARAVVAVDPLLSVDQIWPQHAYFEAQRQRGEGMGEAYEALFAEPFDWILPQISAPTLVLAGDVPLLPPRRLVNPPSLLTDEDLARYAAHPLVTARRIRGGHALLDENPDEVQALASAFFTDPAV